MTACKTYQAHILPCLFFFKNKQNQTRSRSLSNGLVPGWAVHRCGSRGTEPPPYQSLFQNFPLGCPLPAQATLLQKPLTHTLEGAVPICRGP